MLNVLLMSPLVSFRWNCEIVISSTQRLQWTDSVGDKVCSVSFWVHPYNREPSTLSRYRCERLGCVPPSLWVIEMFLCTNYTTCNSATILCLLQSVSMRRVVCQHSRFVRLWALLETNTKPGQLV